MFSSPSNPTGMLYTKNELKAIAEMLARHKNVFVIADEIYEHINFEGKHESLAQFDEIKEQIITVNGVAKGFAMTGWRIGYIGAPLEIAKACDKLQGQVTSATCSIAQRAAIKAMEMNPETSEDIISMRNKFKERRDLMYKLLQEIPGIKTRLPQGAFYFFPEINSYFGKKYDKYTINDSNDLTMYLLYEANVALVPGAAFGDDNCIRFSYATSNELLIEAMNRIKNALEKL
jgi:aspartate aminotransferase